MKAIYLDNAATSWPKPEAVYQAVDAFSRELGAAAGRGAYTAAGEADAIVRRVRQRLARLVGGDDPSRVVLTPGGTESLNLAIHGFVRPGDHVVTTVVEHNSVLRPLAWLRDHADVRLTHIGCDAGGYVDPDEVTAAITPDTRLVAVTHASNVTGAVQPIEAIASLCRKRGCRLLVDAAQTVGHVPIDVGKTPIDLLASPGHKQLLGPLGTGFFWVREGVEAELQPLLQGGTGSQSESDLQPDGMPDRFESGNLNTPALAGLDAALGYLASDEWRSRDADRTGVADELLSGLSSIAGVSVIGPSEDGPRVPVVSITVSGYDPHDVAAVLTSEGIACRAGLHCAGRMHEAIGTAARGGAVRFSPGFATTVEEVRSTLKVVEALVATSS